MVTYYKSIVAEAWRLIRDDLRSNLVLVGVAVTLAFIGPPVGRFFIQGRTLATFTDNLAVNAEITVITVGAILLLLSVVALLRAPHNLHAAAVTELDDIKQAAVRAAHVQPPLSFGEPFSIDYPIPFSPTESGTGTVWRIPMHYRTAMEPILIEAHLNPLLRGREMFDPPVHLLQRAQPHSTLAMHPIELRHGQTAFIDLCGEQDTNPGRSAYLVEAVAFSDGSTYRNQMQIPDGEYRVTLKVLFSQLPAQTITYDVKAANGAVQLLPIGERLVR